MGTEPGNVNLQIQQNPGASSLGNKARAGFGQNVAQLGQQVFGLGAKLQEIKNNTEASRINNEYVKATSEIDSFVPQSPFGFDVDMWAKSEKAKVKNALLKGQSYQVNYPVGSIRDPQEGYSGNVYNMVSDGSGGSIPNAIVKNNAVKRTVGAGFAQTDVKSEVTIQGALATKLYNEKIALKDETVENLEEAFINTMDMDYYYDLFGSEEIKDENGNVLVAGRNGIFADSLSLYNNDDGLRGMFTDREESMGRIADALVTKLDTSIRISAMNYEHPADFDKASQGIDNLRKSLEQKAPDGSYPFLPDVKGPKRQELINKLVTAQGEATKKIADQLDNESTIFKKRRENTSNRKVLTYQSELEAYMEDASIFDPSNEEASDLRMKFDMLDNSIRNDYINGDLTKEHKDDLLTLHAKIRSGDVIPSSIVSLTDAEDVISKSFDVEDLRLAKTKIGNLDINGKDSLALRKRIDSLIKKSPSAIYQSELITRLKNMTGANLSVNMTGMPNGDKLTTALIINAFTSRTNENLTTGKSVERAQMLKIYEEAIGDFINANRNSLNALMSSSDSEIPSMNPYTAFLPSREVFTGLGGVKIKDSIELKYPDINSAEGMVNAYKTHKETLFTDMNDAIEKTNLTADEKNLEYEKVKKIKFLIINSTRETF
jgi:hypothetical protein|tara:strand:- start:4256 stop:6235 length:1980 start_codon:yes stop_codon:yes gene_type:complete